MSTPTVLNIINRGGFGRVERIALANGQIVARKVFDLSAALAGADIDKLRARFQREVKIQSSLSNDFVVPILDHDLNSAEPSFTMPLADRNYHDQIAQERAGGNITVEPLADILNGLEELHRLGYTHRDLKPQNILLHDGHWKLSDFGLALPPTGSTTKLTSVDSAWGTLNYCAPEQATNFAGATPLVDIYAFGCIVHDIYGTGGRIPYARHTASGPIGRIIEKCTDVKPDKRFKNVSALRGALLAVLASPQKVPPTQEAVQWIADFATIPSWTAEKVDDFLKYLEILPEAGEDEPVLRSLEEDHLKNFLAHGQGAGDQLAERYCRWVRLTNFRFSYCDVIIKRLEAIFAVGSVTAKAAAAISAAELGSSHNRWFVMGSLFGLCGSQIEDDVAERIALEIRIEDMAKAFRKSASQVNRPVEDFHPKIAAVLKPAMP